MISEAVESLIRIQSKNLDQQLFNKANEIQKKSAGKDLTCGAHKFNWPVFALR